MDETCDFTGWATKYGVRCADGRTIQPGAFAGNNGMTVPMVWNHNHGSIGNVLGHALLTDRPEGVYCQGFCNDTPEGQRAKEMLKHGDITALSICANSLKQNKINDREAYVTHGVIRELSLVLAGANPGAFIDSVMCHSDDGTPYESDTEAIIYNDDDSLTIEHSEETEEEISEEKDETLEHSDENGEKMADDNKERTVQDVLDSMNEEQLNVVKYLVGSALEDGGNEEGDEEMSHNIFDQTETTEDETLEHALGMDCDMETAITDMRRYGSLKQSFLAHNADIDNLVGEEVIAHSGVAGKSIEEIKNVAGIGDGIFNRIKDLITVN